MHANKISEGIKSLAVKATDIPANHIVNSVNEAMELRNDTKEGDLVSILNRNNLSEVLVYRRTDFQPADARVVRWDGKTTDTSWYDENETTYFIANAEQLAGLNELVESGITFSGKIIRLISNINLNHQEWKPIGGDYTSERVNSKLDEYYKITINPEQTFSGIFDGDSYAIYGLHISEVDEKNKFSGLFRALSHAKVTNLILEDVSIGNDEYSGAFGCLFGYAESTVISNVVVSGSMRGARCAGIGCIALDTSFYSCVNRVSIDAKTLNRGKIAVGGIVQQVGLSNALISKTGGHDAKIFTKCIHDSRIDIDAESAPTIWAGKLYGYIAHDVSSDPYGITIDRCQIWRGGKTYVSNFDKEETNAVFFGNKNDSTTPASYSKNVNEKADLLGGLLGKTNSSINVTVINITKSVNIESVVIPGSVNTLSSVPSTQSFITIDTNPLKESDGICNLIPYFSYIKTANV